MKYEKLENMKILIFTFIILFSALVYAKTSEDEKYFEGRYICKEKESVGLRYDINQEALHKQAWKATNFKLNIYYFEELANSRCDGEKRSEKLYQAYCYELYEKEGQRSPYKKNYSYVELTEIKAGLSKGQINYHNGSIDFSLNTYGDFVLKSDYPLLSIR